MIFPRAGAGAPKAPATVRALFPSTPRPARDPASFAMSKDEQTTDKPTEEPKDAAAPPKQRKIVRRSGTTRDNPVFAEAPAGRPSARRRRGAADAPAAVDGPALPRGSRPSPARPPTVRARARPRAPTTPAPRARAGARRGAASGPAVARWIDGRRLPPAAGPPDRRPPHPRRLARARRRGRLPAAAGAPGRGPADPGWIARPSGDDSPRAVTEPGHDAGGQAPRRFGDRRRPPRPPSPR